MHARRLEAAWFGPPASERPPIVLLHEGLGSVSRWRELPAAIVASTGCRVMAYSRFGHGASDPPAAPHTTHFMHAEAALLPEVLDAANIGEALFFGHSDGASIALILAATHPSRARALILEAPHVFVEEIGVASIEALRVRYEQTDLRTRLARHHADPDVAFHGWSDVWLAPEFRSWNLEGYLSRVTCPVLLIQGEDDRFGTLRQLDAIQRQLAGPVQRLVLADCGHSPHRDQPEAVLAAVSDFVKRWA